VDNLAHSPFLHSSQPASYASMKKKTERLRRIVHFPKGAALPPPVTPSGIFRLTAKAGMKGQETKNRIRNPGRTKGAALARYKISALRVLAPPTPKRAGAPQKAPLEIFPLATPDFASRAGLHLCKPQSIKSKKGTTLPAGQPERQRKREGVTGGAARKPPLPASARLRRSGCFPAEPYPP
jgi:hypothetical protein